MQSKLSVPISVPSWALNIDQDQLDELGREDRWLREIEAGETPPAIPIDRDWSTVKQVAERHGCSEKTIRRARSEGTLKARAINPDAPPRQRRYRIHRDDELAWVEAKKAVVRPPAAPRTTAASRRTFRERIAR